MDKVAKEGWCEALRSGEFEQDFYALETYSGFCCLGVLQEIFQGIAEVNRSDVDLNNPARKLLDLKKSDMNHLIGMNDDCASFPEIADWIENHL